MSGHVRLRLYPDRPRRFASISEKHAGTAGRPLASLRLQVLPVCMRLLPPKIAQEKPITPPSDPINQLRGYAGVSSFYVQDFYI